MMKNMLTVVNPWRTVLLVILVAATDVLLSLLSIGFGLQDGTVPDFEQVSFAVLRFVLAPVLAPLGAVALIWRHRFPRTVAVATAVLGTISLSGIAFVIALFLLAKRRLDWWVAAVVALSLAMEALVGLETTDWQYVAALGLAVYGAIAVWGAYRGQRRRLWESQMAALKDQAAHAQAERVTGADRARLAERHRIAREMHDTLAHRMSLVAVQAAALQVDAADPETASSARLIRETAHAALGELREVLGVLREDGTSADERSYAANAPSGVGAPSDVTAPSGVAAPSGIAQIAGLVAQWRLAGILVDYSQLPEDPVVIPDAVSRAAFRVVQEGLTNVARHAPGSRAHVNLELPAATTGPTELHVTVANGAGGPGEPVPGAGLGLVGLAERVQILGGTVEHGHNAQGFELVACIPFTPVLHNHRADCEGASA
ncbi:sensor histidine kinase [Arthrobacter psychrochitiniphilus]|uniref:histidine kinase n=1 Tax=Arthrobacter psychrochitiniphilus TaxID=291045 RepID=A0A2V3DS33_9MICC|nr:histidine kinase [Arthrobacter psychrochitiniphilus]NYG18145.1 signal transduction histidine kinase [Arthrobacter psychrochitiniphilus]PXA65046.1 hypothetical protein CVS29_12785 [Arthrobacter psychrochitiniphilus]